MNTKAILIVVVSMVAIASLSVIIFMHYGGNACDQPPEFTCDCFCCSFFGSRGYEACGNFGLLVGSISGLILGIFLYRIVRIRKK